MLNAWLIGLASHVRMHTVMQHDMIWIKIIPELIMMTQLVSMSSGRLLQTVITHANIRA